jgi:acetolactate synthase-1/2/3 large subunit
VGALWDEADLVIGIGTDFDGVMTQNWMMPQPPRLVCVNVDAADATKNYAADVVLVGDARDVTEQLVSAVPRRAGAEATLARLERVGAAVAAAVLADDPDAAAFLAIMESAVPPDAVVAAVCVCGDGGFLFACGELATVAEAEVPLTVVLVDDGGYGMLRFDQELAGDEPFGVDLAGPDFEALGRSFGIAATTVDGFGRAFETALTGAVASSAPSLIVVTARLKPPPTTSPRWYRRPR